MSPPKRPRPPTEAEIEAFRQAQRTSTRNEGAADALAPQIVDAINKIRQVRPITSPQLRPDSTLNAMKRSGILRELQAELRTVLNEGSRENRSRAGLAAAGPENPFQFLSGRQARLLDLFPVLGTDLRRNADTPAQKKAVERLNRNDSKAVRARAAQAAQGLLGTRRGRGATLATPAAGIGLGRRTLLSGLNPLGFS